jgi:uncharacterized protein (UPF0332 family)
MSEEIRLHFERAAECVDDANLLLDNGRYAAAVTRAYYAMFHAATAVLLTKDIRRTSHRGILSAFGEQVVKTGLLDRSFHRYFREAFDLRQQSDYEPVVDVDTKHAKQILSRAVDFVDACRRLIGS